MSSFGYHSLLSSPCSHSQEGAQVTHTHTDRAGEGCVYDALAATGHESDLVEGGDTLAHKVLCQALELLRGATQQATLPHSLGPSRVVINVVNRPCSSAQEVHSPELVRSVCVCMCVCVCVWVSE